MHTRTICNSRSNISVKRPQFAPDRKLAFVESICEELIKDRFGPCYVFDSPTRSAPESVPPAVAGAVLGRAGSGGRRDESVPHAVAGGVLGHMASQASQGESVPPAAAGGALGRMAGGSSYGSCDVPASQRVLDPLRAPVTIVPGSDRRSVLAQPRGSPRVALAF